MRCVLQTSKELELVLLLIRSKLEMDDASLMAFDVESVDWKLVAQMVRFHCVLPLVFETLKKRFAERMPSGLVAELGAEHSLWVGVAFSLLKDLFDSAKVLSGAKIDFATFKGPASGQQFYGDPFLRHFTDVDFWVPEGEFERATKLLLQQPGYVLFDYPEFRLSPAFKKLAGAVSIYRQNSRCNLDLHWYIREHMNLSVDDYRANIRQIVLFDNTVPTLSPELLLVMHCDIAPVDRWMKLSWILEVDRIISAVPEMNWDLVDQLTRKVGYRNCLVLGLRLARDIFGTSIPARYQAEADAEYLTPLVSDTLGLLEYASDELPRPGMRALVYRLRLARSLPAQVEMIRRRAFTPTFEDWVRLPLPRLLMPLYPLVRAMFFLGEETGILRKRDT